jgi:hypothetical protein
MKMEDALTVVKLIPVVIAAVKSIEEFLPVSGAGKQKMDLVMNTVQEAFDNVTSAWPTIQPILEKLIAGLVSLANAFGVFKKSTPAA